MFIDHLSTRFALLSKPIKKENFTVPSGVVMHPVKAAWPAYIDLRESMQTAFGLPNRELKNVWGWYIEWRGKTYAVSIGPTFKLCYCVGELPDDGVIIAILKQIKSTELLRLIY